MPIPDEQCDDDEHATYVALIHGIGASSHEAWVEQSVGRLSDWWTTIGRGVDAEPVTCPDGCKLSPGHKHLLLSTQGQTRRVDLEALFWGDCVRRPGPGRCAWLVLQAGLLIGLVDMASAWLTAFEQFADWKSEIELARSVWRLISTFLRAAVAPMLTLFVAVAVLVSSRLRATIGDGLAWGADERSRERVQQKLLDALRGTKSSRVVLIGHSQGGSIAADLEPALRADGREVRLVTLGSGHGLLAAMQTVLPRWSLAKSLVSWTVLLSFSVLSIAALVTGTAQMLRPFAPLAAEPVRVAGHAWLSQLLPLAQTHQLLPKTDLSHLVQHQLQQPLVSLPPIVVPAVIASTALAVLLITIGVEPARSLLAATRKQAAGIDIVATHDLVAAAMLQLGPVERRRRVSQCGSVLLDHTSYFRNGCTVLPLLAEQVERAAALPGDENDNLGALAMEEYHRSGLALRSWTRPLLFVSIAAAFGGFAAGRMPSVVWIFAASACCLLVSLALTVSSARWLTRALRELDGDYRTAMVLERERWRRARPRWAGALAFAAIPLIGGAAVTFTTPSILHSLAKQPGLPILTLVAFIVGVALCTLAWRSLFGFQRGAWTTAAVTLAALLWLLQGTGESAGVAALMLMLAYWSYRRERRQRRLLESEWDDAFDLG